MATKVDARIDWRLSAYTALSAIFWVLALGPGGGGTSKVGVNELGALINLILLVPLWRGSKWPAVPLAIEAVVLAGAIGSGGMPPGGPAFGFLALGAVVQLLLLCSLVGGRRNFEDAP